MEDKNVLELKIKKNLFDRNKIINNIEKKLNSCGLDKKYIGNMIRGIHIALPICALIIISFAPKILVWLTILFFISVIIFFIIFNGCILSILETKYLKDEFNIMDPFLYIMNCEINNANRIQISGFFAFLYLILIFIIYNLRYNTTIPKKLLSLLPEYLR
tara:strand:- start:759 stop:1238 length:480 start_codon:yes stop_codon:yes gene_type:complete